MEVNGLITVAEAAKLFNVNEQIPKKWAQAGAPHTRGRKEGQRGGHESIFFNPDELRAWLIVNQKEGYNKSLFKNAEEVEKKLDAENPKAPEQVKIDSTPGLIGAVNRLRAAELTAFGKYLEARRSGNMTLESARLTLYVDAAKALKQLESIVDDRELVEKDIWEQIEQLLNNWIETVRAFVESAPSAMAPRLNPSDPTVAEAAMRDWIQNQLLPVMSRKLK